MPPPEAGTLDELNAYLEECRRVLAGGSETVGAVLLVEQGVSGASELFDLAKFSFPTVDGQRCMRLRTHCFSVSLRPWEPMGKSHRARRRSALTCIT